MNLAVAVIVFAILVVSILIPVVVGIWSREWMMNVVTVELAVLVTGYAFIKNPVEGTILVILILILSVDKIIANFKKAKKAEK